MITDQPIPLRRPSKKQLFTAALLRHFEPAPFDSDRWPRKLDMLKAPEVERHWALFLDLDGTLLDIAAAPDKVLIPPGLTDALARVGAALGGALAVVSGRRLDEVDSLLSPLCVPVAAEHGALIRFPSGEVHSVPATRCLPPGWIEQLRDATRGWDGILIEEKIYSVALHYRLAPNRKSAVRQLAMSLVRSIPDRFELLTARDAFEIRAKGITKGHAVEFLMNQEPFSARQPVFVGDDITDEDGMEAAVRLGGLGLNVGAFFEGRPLAVRDWLKRAADTLG